MAKKQPINQEWRELQKEVRDLGQELMDSIGGSKEIFESLSDIEQELVVAAQKHLALKTKDLTTTKQDLTNIQKKLEYQTQINDRISEMKSQGNIFTQWHDTLKSLVIDLEAMAQNPMLATGLLATSVANDFRRMVQSTFEVQKNMGLTGSQTLQLAKNVGAASLSGLVLGYGFQEAAEAAQGLIEATGDLTEANTENIKLVAKMASWYGVSATDAAKLQVMSVEIGENTLDTYVSMANMAGVMPGRIMGDMAQNAEFFAKYAREGGTNIAEAAISAQQLGLSLSEVESISSNLLNIESSIESEMQASVLLGRQLSLNKARELALAGDMNGMMEEVVKNLGDANEWEKMNVLQREAFAGAVGISISQMQTMIAQQDDLNNQTAFQETTWGKITMHLKAVGKGAMSFKETLISLGNFSFAMMNNFKAMGGILNKLPTGKLNQLGSFLTGTGGKGVAQLPKDAVNINKASNTFGKVKVGNMLQGAAAMVLMAATIWILAKALQELNKVDDIWATLAVAGVALLGFTVALAAVGAIMLFAGPLVLAGAGAMLMMAATLWVLGKALQEIAKPMESLATGIGMLAEIADVLPQIGVGFAAMGLGLFGLAGGLLAVAPLLPILAAVTGLNAINARSMETATTVDGNKQVAEKLDTIILLLEQGADIRIGDQKVGRWLGKYQSSVNALEN